MHTATSIPLWNSEGFLPPNDSLNPTSANRSPYQCSLLDFVLRFSTTPDRTQILNGFLNYRAGLHQLGLTNGFQWLDGSFLENVEVLESRAPRDIDVVTFLHFPLGFDQTAAVTSLPELFISTHSKPAFHVDAFVLPLNIGTAERLVRNSHYWYSVWSHRRTGQWKGFVEVSLDPTQDAIARANLTPSLQGATP